MGQAIAPPLPLAIPFQAAAGTHQATATIDMTFYYREDDTGVCHSVGTLAGTAAH